MLFNEITSEEFAEIRAKEAAEEFFEKGMKKGIAGLIETCQEFGLSKENTLIKVMDKFSLSEESVEEYMQEFWRV